MLEIEFKILNKGIAFLSDFTSKDLFDAMPLSEKHLIRWNKY